MKNGYKNIMTSRCMRFFLFIVLAYFSQVSPFYHTHHFHEDGLLAFEISNHTSDVEVEHTSEHNHDHDLPHTNDHQHAFGDQIDWNIVRTQSLKTLSHDSQYIVSSVSSGNVNSKIRSYLDYDKPPNIQTFETSTVIIRGPPLLA